MSTKQIYDVIVAGAGAMGSAAAYALAKQGAKALVLERSKTPHNHGSSHGHTRLIRKAYFEHPDYVPLLHEAYKLWREIGDQWPKQLFYKTGLIAIGEPFHPVLQGIKHAAEQHDLKLQQLTNKQLQSTYPMFRTTAKQVGLYEEDGGCLLSSECIQAMCRLAENHGVVFKWWSPVVDWKYDNGIIRVKTDKQTWLTKKLIFTTGAWIKDLWRLPRHNLVVRRVPVFWADAPPTFDLEAQMPAFAFALSDGFYYGMPNIEQSGVKVALHKGLEELPSPDDLKQELHEGDFAPIKEFLREYIPDINPTYKSYSVCMYTMSEDEHFFIGSHPDCEQVQIASACSGHGFKFAPVVGQALAELALEGESSLPIGFLSLNR